MSNWLLDYYEQNNRIAGKQHANGRLELYDLPSWEERKLMRTNANGELVFEGMPKEKNPVLVSKPGQKGLSNKEYQDGVKSYAEEFRSRVEAGKTRTGYRSNEKFNN